MITNSQFSVITVFHQELIPTSLLFSMAKAGSGVPFNSFHETVILLSVFELLKEAGIHTADHGEDDKQNEEHQEGKQEQVSRSGFPHHQLAASFVQCNIFISQGNPPLNFKVIRNSE